MGYDEGKERKHHPIHINSVSKPIYFHLPLHFKEVKCDKVNYGCKNGNIDIDVCVLHVIEPSLIGVKHK